MNIKTTPFKEVFILKPTLHLDERGSFMESFNEREVEKVLGKKTMFCQDNLTHSKKGVLRGLHYQLPPFSQTKLVSVIQGSVLDVVVDIRKGSPTFGQYFSFELSDDSREEEGSSRCPIYMENSVALMIKKMFCRLKGFIEGMS